MAAPDGGPATGGDRAGDGRLVLGFEDAAGWESWLAANHDREPGVWLRIARKHSGRALVSITEALDVALCYGWIDSQRKGLDETQFLQKYGPRRPRSAWSQVNIAKVEALRAAGRMRAPGLAEVAAAVVDGRWQAAYESQRTATVPPDLAAELAGRPLARARFEALGRTERYRAILQLLRTRTDKGRATGLRRLIQELETGGERFDR